MDYSASETSCSSVLGLDDIIKNDKVRYIRKGYGIIFAIFIALSFFILGPQFMYIFWPYLDDFTGFKQNKILKIIYIEDSQKKSITLIPNHLFFYLLSNIVYIFIYWLKHPFFERYKILNKPWPWEKDPAKFFTLCRVVAKNWVINASLGIIIGLIDSYFGISNLRCDTKSLPNSYELIWQISFCMIMEDFVFYFSHRILHHPKLYPLIHKQHHKFYNTVSFAAEYSHPIEYVFGNIIPTFSGVNILGDKMHLATVNLWLFMRVMETVDGHCGYEFSWSPYRLLPFSGSSEYHNFHHSQNVGNYGSFFYYLDTFFATNNDYFRYKSEKDKEIRLQKLRNQYQEARSKKID